MGAMAIGDLIEAVSVFSETLLVFSLVILLVGASLLFRRWRSRRE